MHWWQLVSAVVVERRASWAGDGGAGREEADGGGHALVLTTRAVIVEGANGSRTRQGGRETSCRCVVGPGVGVSRQSLTLFTPLGFTTPEMVFYPSNASQPGPLHQHRLPVALLIMFCSRCRGDAQWRQRAG
jgi:hypothetical protein